MSDRRTDLIHELELAGELTATFFGRLSARQLASQVYQDGAQWTVQQVLAHLVTIEKSMHWLFRNILQGGPGAPEDFDIERFNRSQPKKLDGLSLAELIDRFRAVRTETADIVKQMQEDDLDRQGRHAFHGPGRLERFIRWAYEHARIHEVEIFTHLYPAQA